MKKQFLTFLLLTNVLFAASQTQWKVGTSSVTFKINNAGIPVNGSFGGLIADIKFDADNLAKSSMEASIDVNTINTGINLRDNHLKKEEYFNVTVYPKISIVSTSFSKDNEQLFKGFFKLTIKGTTKDIVIPFSYSESGNSVIFQATFSLDRRDYNVGKNSLIMADEVTVHIVISATK